MKLYYFKNEEGNFGDDLNPWLWEKIFPGFLDEGDSDLFVGVGTLLNHRIPEASSVTIFGSGYGYGELPAANQNWRFYCVRGPLTAKALNLPEDLAITDPAALVPEFYSSKAVKKYPVSFMPHCDSARMGNWKTVCKEAGIHYIDPRNPFLQVFDQIRQSEVLLTEAMHGAILADSFRVPWLPVKAYPHISEFKWQDWLQSVAIQANFNVIDPIWCGDDNERKGIRLKNKLKRALLGTPLWRSEWGTPPPKKSSDDHLARVAKQLSDVALNNKPILSSSDTFTKNTERLMEKVQALKKDYGI